jgi:hypothetical protein
MTTTKLTFATFAAAIVAATLLSAPVPAATNGNAQTVANVAAQDWCSGPRQGTDYRCFKQ